MKKSYTIVTLSCLLGGFSLSAAESSLKSETTVHRSLMENESVVFCSDLQAGKARLLFDPVEIQSVKRADGSAVLEKENGEECEEK